MSLFTFNYRVKGASLVSQDTLVWTTNTATMPRFQVGETIDLLWDGSDSYWASFIFFLNWIIAFVCISHYITKLSQVQSYIAWIEKATKKLHWISCELLIYISNCFLYALLYYTVNIASQVLFQMLQRFITFSPALPSKHSFSATSNLTNCWILMS